jgi:hypothetical protein
MRKPRSAGANRGIAAVDPDDLDGLEESERARLLPELLGVSSAPSSLHYIARATDGHAPAHVFDEESGMVYVRD